MAGAMSRLDSSDLSKKWSLEGSPIRMFFYFNKAIRCELHEVHRVAIAYATDPQAVIKPLLKRFRFLHSIYKYHCIAEDEPGHVQGRRAEEELLQQIIFTWMVGVKNDKKCKSCIAQSELRSPSDSNTNTSICSTASSKILLSDCCPSNSTLDRPLDELLHWHKAIKREVNDIVETTRTILLSGDFSDISTFNKRLEFISEVCIFHRYALILYFPEHAEEESNFEKFRCLIKSIESAGTNSSSAELYSKLYSHANDIMGALEKHFDFEEVQVFPLARQQFSIRKQRELAYQSLCVMPLRLIECVVPWLLAISKDPNSLSLLFSKGLEGLQPCKVSES
ncbi:hypothetical protein POM88_015138 [Heracleum sosnowskyi]|uniref:Hemerythrin-like domain-containing protein n=1 Tax=Heracleum sosnowskyi TaxID=360622 RepID=A0AAD8IJM5_9APIA|nr:hypothetical protein POM88_015138 [Heracleum sosnowskyi]